MQAPRDLVRSTHDVASPGALVGPPWAKRENGFLFSEAGGITLYYEPHCDYDESSLAGIASVDMVITPVVNQELLSFPLVRCSFAGIKLFDAHSSALCASLRPSTAWAACAPGPVVYAG